MPLQLDDLAALDAPTVCDGRPIPLPLDSIDEDPAQPRREFDANGLLELAATMRDRGVRQPISVRPNPKHAGRWVLNFGAREAARCEAGWTDRNPRVHRHHRR
jgi:ParB family chromosome partitioning protein